MKLLTVKMHGRTGDDSDFVTIYLKDVNYIDLWQRTKHSERVLAFHTSNGSYLALTTLSEAHNAFKEHGFEMLGRTAIVNLKRIKNITTIEQNGSIITFQDGTHINVRKQV